YQLIMDARFVGGDNNRVTVSSYKFPDWSVGTTEYRRSADGTWQVADQSKGEPKVMHNGIEITVKQSFNQPPQLVVIGKQTSRVIWDPNPQLKNFDLGQASVYKWKDKEGRELRAGLFKPRDYKPARRYP